ncbi:MULTISPECIES: ArsR/SmtB family transcription factor [Cohnella]|uniref:ArsR/SmtB family transcription factor n=1 Tax=Cohnella TaxID=329857 RepID=UPI00037DA354|nr:MULTISPECIES: ArsR family transcriptional regulator [Cohnella]
MDHHLDVRLDVQFKPLYEAINSLHTYICRKSHKKIDIGASWAHEVRRRLTPEFASLLDQSEIDFAWKLTYLLVHLCPSEDVDGFLAWLEGMSAGDLYELISPYSQQFPERMGEFRARTLTVFAEWNKQYFKETDPAIVESLRNEERDRKRALTRMPPEEFVDQTTNGLIFKSTPGLEQLVLIPQYHFQPMNVIYCFGGMTVCHYAARIYFNETDFLSTHEYRMIRCLGERSRLKILRYLHNGPRTFIEIVRHLQLSKGITHDHLSKLRMAGLIYAHFEGESLTEYSLRPKALEQMQSKLMAYIRQA